MIYFMYRLRLAKISICCVLTRHLTERKISINQHFCLEKKVVFSSRLAKKSDVVEISQNDKANLFINSCENEVSSLDKSTIDGR